MKNTIFALAFAFLGMSLHAQEGLKLGVHAGLPIDDFNDSAYSLLAS